MLKEITIESYKSLKNVTVQFKDGLNIIIGKNGSGKSNLLEFIEKVLGINLFIDSFKSKKIPDPIFEYVFDIIQQSHLIETTVQIYKDKFNENAVLLGRNTDGVDSVSLIYDEIDKVGDLFSFFTAIPMLSTLYLKYSIPNDVSWLDRTRTYVIDKATKTLIDTEQNELLFSKGFYFYIKSYLVLLETNNFNNENADGKVESFLHDRFIEFKEVTQIVSHLSKFSPIQDITLGKNINIYAIGDTIRIENLYFEFKINNKWIPWSYLSDGTKRCYYIIAQVLCSKEGITLIEEPELGIHPHQLYKLMQFIKEQSEEKQIIISTHSPLILDTLEADELDRITIAKIENGSSKFIKLTEEQTEHAKKYMHEQMDLSFYWLHADMEEQE